MLLATIGLLAFGADVGKATNAAKNEKTVFLVTDNPLDFISVMAELQDFNGIILVESPKTIETQISLINLDLIMPTLIIIDDILPGELKPYKQNGHIKTKYHADHLFNPVKRC